jgi:hypothetical protein
VDEPTPFQCLHKIEDEIGTDGVDPVFHSLQIQGKIQMRDLMAEGLECFAYLLHFESCVQFVFGRFFGKLVGYD